MSNENNDSCLGISAFLDLLGDTDSREERIVMARIGGQSVHALARRERISVGEVNRIIGKWADALITDDTRKNHLALELARLDMLQSTILRQAMTGDVASEQLVERIIARRAVMLGLHTPQAQVVQIIDATPKQTSTDKIEAVLDELMKMDRAQGASSEEDEPPPY